MKDNAGIRLKKIKLKPSEDNLEWGAKWLWEFGF